MKPAPAGPAPVRVRPTLFAMSSYLPLFPLNLVAFPHEKLNLHIFEPRYRQLINECLEERKTFGIPAFLGDRVQKYGTEIRVKALSRRYDDGRMDIETEGVRVFRLLQFQKLAPGKLYPGGEIEFLDEDETFVDDVRNALIVQVKRLYGLLKMPIELDMRRSNCISYELAHKLGLSVEQEYELLTIRSEGERQAFLLRHLERAIPVVADMERTKERIKLNGHFKHFDPLTF
jgi:Lon protease-like protein